jgi:iron complex outermembrane receptor protein
VAALPLFSAEVDTLLEEYNHKNALSQKTIDENKGHLVLYTRERLEKMHAKTLKDVFKTTPVIYYKENRYALTDPMMSGSIEAYRSNFIRLYIDGVEITHGWAGSGLLLYGDVNIDFVDHIEFYYTTPSMESSVEPAFLTIFLYSKDPKRDSGSKLNLVGGSHGYNMQTFSYGEAREDFSYMVNISHTDAKREKIDNGTDTPLSRDFERLQLFTYVKTEKQMFHLQIMKKYTDSMAGASWDATPVTSEIDYMNLHTDYSIDLTENWHFLVSYDWLKIDMRESDNQPIIWTYPSINDQFDAITENTTLTTELTYKKVIGKHHLNAGLKLRNKTLDSVEYDGHTVSLPAFNREQISTIFIQDQYALASNQMLTLGVSYSDVDRNGGIDDDSLVHLRLGYIFTEEEWSYKAYLFRTQLALEPLIRYFFSDIPADINPQTTWGITQEVGYSWDTQHVRMILSLMRDEDSQLQRTLGSDTVTKYITSILDYEYNFDKDNKAYVQFYYAHYKDIFGMDELDDIGGYFSLFNSYGGFDFYNGVVWHRNSVDWKNYFDWTSSVTWNISDSFTLTLKGDNILNKAQESELYRFDISNGVPTPTEPLSISPIDRRFTIELEYLF